MKRALAFLLIASAAFGCDADDPAVIAPTRGARGPGAGNPGALAVGDDAGGGEGSPDGGGTLPPPEAAVATGVSISEIAVYQAVKISIAKAGQRVTKRNAPVVAKRDALVRVSVAREAGYAGQPITAELRLATGDGEPKIFRDTKVVPTAATDDALGSTFNFEVPGESLPAGVQFAVTLRDSAAPAGARGAPEAVYPAGGTPEDLDAKRGGEQLKIVLVPLKYDADGSGRLPDVSEAQLARYRAAFFGVYPTAKVDITVHTPIAHASPMAATTGIGDALEAVVTLRAEERPAKDVYYYGIISPTESFATFCVGPDGCTTGLSGVGEDARDASVRASVGVGFTGGVSTETAAHEVGHAHGRFHAPCGGVASSDPSFPYAGGTMGEVWGYDLGSKKLVDPAKGKDIMGYCSPKWISDYNYGALFDRMKIVNGASAVAAFAEPKRYRKVRVAADGSLSWRGAVQLDSPPYAAPHDVTYVDAKGQVVATVTGHFYAYDHLAGGYMLVPDSDRPFASARVAGMGEIR